MKVGVHGDHVILLSRYLKLKACIIRSFIRMTKLYPNQRSIEGLIDKILSLFSRLMFATKNLLFTIATNEKPSMPIVKQQLS